MGPFAVFLVGPALDLTLAGEFGTKLVFDFLFAYILGVAFQYFTIVPMRGLPFGKGLMAAVRADTISIALFEVACLPGWRSSISGYSRRHFFKHRWPSSGS